MDLFNLPTVVGVYNVNNSLKRISKVFKPKYFVGTIGNDLSIEIQDDSQDANNVDLKGKYSAFFDYLNHNISLVKEFSSLYISRAGFITTADTIINICDSFSKPKEEVFIVYLYEGNIYLFNYESRNKNAWVDLKFANRMVSYDLSKQGGDTEPMEEEQQYCIYKMNFHGHRLLYSGKVDGIMADKKSKKNDSEFLKGDLTETLSKQRHFALMTLHDYSDIISKTGLRTMLNHNFFSGIKDFVVGYVQEGTVVRTQHFKKNDIIKLKSKFAPNDNRMHCQIFLNHVKISIDELLKKDYHSTPFKNVPILKFYFKISKNITIPQLINCSLLDINEPNIPSLFVIDLSEDIL